MIGDKTSVVICGNLPAHVHFPSGNSCREGMAGVDGGCCPSRSLGESMPEWYRNSLGVRPKCLWCCLIENDCGNRLVRLVLSDGWNKVGGLFRPTANFVRWERGNKYPNQVLSSGYHNSLSNPMQRIEIISLKIHHREQCIMNTFFSHFWASW